MHRVNYGRSLAVILASVLVVGLASPVGATSLPAEQDTSEASITLQINCQKGTVQVTAPADIQYRVQVAVINVTPTSTTASRTSSGPYSGNATISFDEAGLVHAFVTVSEDRVVESTVTDCSGPTKTTTVPDVESITIDCNESTVSVTGSPDVRYNARITVAKVSPGQQAITSVATGPHTGNSTIQFSEILNATSQTDRMTSKTDGNVTVYAFVSTEQTNVTSAVTRCRTG